jgi:hypothetical protein
MTETHTTTGTRETQTAQTATHEINRRHIHMATRTFKGIISASATAALGAALFVGSGFIGGSAASAAPAGLPALPPGCTTAITCPTEPLVNDPPPPTPTCAKITCQVVGDLDDLPVLEPVEPEPTPCTKPICQVVGDFDDLPVLEEVDPAPPTTPEPTTPDPTPTTPDPTPATPVEPTPTTPPAPPVDNGANNPPSGGQPTTGGSENPPPAQGGQQTTGGSEDAAQTEDEDEPAAVAETSDEEDPTETEATAEVQAAGDDSGFSILTVALAAFGLAAPASIAAYFLARRQKAPILD